MKNKYAKTIDDSLYHELDEHADTISYSSKNVDARDKPVTYTHV